MKDKASGVIVPPSSLPFIGHKDLYITCCYQVTGKTFGQCGGLKFLMGGDSPILRDSGISI